MAVGLVGKGATLRVIVPKALRDLVLFINRFLMKSDCLESWTSIQVNRNSVSQEHKDQGNEGPSAPMGLGQFEGASS